jgi:hypothetical protein
MGGEEELEEPPQFVWIMMLGVARLQVQVVQGSGAPGVCPRRIKKGFLSARDGLLMMHIPSFQIP